MSTTSCPTACNFRRGSSSSSGRPTRSRPTRCDWGFKVTNLFGIDYRYTTAKGWFSDQLLKHNNLYGYDPLQLYFDLYFPRIAQGMILRVGRYISPIDIEAQLSPENYLYSHSVMYSVRPLHLHRHPGHLQAQRAMVRHNSDPRRQRHGPLDDLLAAQRRVPAEVGRPTNNKDIFFGGVDSIGKGYYKNRPRRPPGVVAPVGAQVQ